MTRVLITGASQGVGRATALELIERGHEVIATARNVDAVHSLGAAMSLSLDVTDERSVTSALAAAGRIDAVISNAGQTVRGPLETTPIAEFERLFQLNTIGALRVIQGVLPQMRERCAGRILLVSSILGRVAAPMSGAYAASKWALEAIAETLALETASFGIAVTLLEPGRISSLGPQSAPTFFDADGPYSHFASPIAGTPAAEAGLTMAATPTETAIAIADTVESVNPAFRVPVGVTATLGLKDRRDATDAEPFVWMPRLS